MLLILLTILFSIISFIHYRKNGIDEVKSCIFKFDKFLTYVLYIMIPIVSSFTLAVLTSVIVTEIKIKPLTTAVITIEKIDNTIDLREESIHVINNSDSEMYLKTTRYELNTLGVILLDMMPFARYSMPTFEIIIE